MRLLRAFVIAAVSTVLLMGPAAPAEATLAGYRWARGVICVIDMTGSRWPINSAVYRWDMVPDLYFVYGDCSSDQKIRVVEGWYGRSGHWYGRAAEAVIWTVPDVWGSTDRITRVTIRLNDSYLYLLSWENRKSLIEHELGHASGLDHTTYWSSIMNPKRIYYYTWPTPYDRSEVERHYPW